MGILRLLLALSVVASHCGLILGSELVGGKIAVQAFYIISGFYMSMILNEKYIGKNSSYKLFISNRLLRIYPVYWAVLILTILFWVLAEWKTHGQSISIFDNYRSTQFSLLSMGYLIVSQLIIFGQDVVMFLGINPNTGSLFFTSDFWHTKPGYYTFLFLPQAWTLGIELTFYLVAPFIVRKKNWVVILLIALSFLLRLYLYNGFSLTKDPWTYRFFPTEILFFLLGFIAYKINLVVKKMQVPGFVNMLLLGSIILFSIFYSSIPETRSFDSNPFMLKEIAYFVLVVGAIPFLFNYFKKNNIDKQLGELSYPVYISHLFVVGICRIVHIDFLTKGAVVALLTIAFSFLLNKLIADPIEKYRQLRVSK